MGIFSGDIYSQSLMRTTGIQIIFPDVSQDVTPLFEGGPKVLYLLHGLGGNASDWVRFSKIEYYAKKYNFIVIMPDAQRSFYCNEYGGIKYREYIVEELPQICEKWFHIPLEKERTFAAGDSMGGYGAYKMVLLHPEKYAAAASLSGVLDFPWWVNHVKKREIEYMEAEERNRILGPDGKISEKDDILCLARKVSAMHNRPKLLQICGTEDFLYESNKEIKRQLDEMQYSPTYMEWSGDHEWPFWDVAVQRAFQFFCKMDIKKSRIF